MPLLDEYIEKGGQRLRLGYTTGSCAAAAAKAAALMLCTGQAVSQVRLRTPKGLEILLDIEDVQFFYKEEVSAEGPAAAENPEGARQLLAVTCAVRKDSGDDPDITNQALIYARVAFSPQPGIRIEGGEGVGRVTKPGLDQPVGNAAINSTPRRMIEAAVLEAAERQAPSPVGFDVTIFVPRGRELAARTFNPRLGIIGGISILGTSGIVEPMSDQALLDTIRVEIRVRRGEGLPILAAAPGNYGKNYFLEKYGFSLDTAVTSSNFIYDTVRMAADAGFTRLLFVGHIGKLVKVADGIRNTHSKYGDHRMEILAQIAQDLMETDPRTPSGATGAPAPDTVSADLRAQMDACVATDEAIRILRAVDPDLAQAILAEMTLRIRRVMEDWADGRLKAEVIVFSNIYGELGRTDNALDYIRILRAWHS